MEPIEFKAFAVAREIHLNKIAMHCGIPKKFTWEQPLVLTSETLTNILKRPISPTQQVLLFSFGSIVFINFKERQEMKVFLEFIQTFESNVDFQVVFRYADDYKLQVVDTETTTLTDEYVEVQEYEAFYPELISTVLAKSVALERTEEKLGEILDKLETVIDNLEKGKLRIGNKQLAKTSAEILRHEYNTLAYIMILDKPDVTWGSSTAKDFYDQMVEFFELTDRYHILKSKTEFLSNTMDGFATISHATRGLFVEWIVVVLIVFEIILTLLGIAGWLPHQPS